MTQVNEKSTYTVTVSWKDSDGNLISLDSLKWSLVTYEGTTVNSRDQVEITNPDNEQKITLSGDDLAILDNRGIEQRWLITEATYTDNDGATRPLTGSYQFSIKNLKKVGS